MRFLHSSYAKLFIEPQKVMTYICTCQTQSRVDVHTRKKATVMKLAEKIEIFATEMKAAIDARVSYESSKNAANDSIQTTLAKFRKSVSHDDIVKAFVNANVDSSFINRSERVNARLNVYCAEKVANIARTIASVESLNHYTLAIFKSTLALNDADKLLNHKSACAACSLNCDCDAATLKLLKRYEKHVAANTASTQSSSSINALLIFNVLEETRDDSNAIAYRVNRKSAATKQLAKALNIEI